MTSQRGRQVCKCVCFFNVSKETQTFLNWKDQLSGTFQCSSRFKCIFLFKLLIKKTKETRCFIKEDKIPATNFSSRFSSWIQFHSFSRRGKRGECAGILATYQMSPHEVAAECESSGPSLRFALGAFCGAQLSKHEEPLAFTASCRWTALCNCATVQQSSGQSDLPACFSSVFKPCFN